MADAMTAQVHAAPVSRFRRPAYEAALKPSSKEPSKTRQSDPPPCLPPHGDEMTRRVFPPPFWRRQGGGQGDASAAELAQQFDQLVEALVPAEVEAHVLVLLPLGLAAVEDSHGVVRLPGALLKGEDGGEGHIAVATRLAGGGAVARPEDAGPHDLLVPDDLEEAADARMVLAFRRAHHRAKDAAGARIELALDGRPGLRCPPFLDVLRVRPHLPDERPGRVDRAGQGEIEAVVMPLCVVCHACVPCLAGW